MIHHSLTHTRTKLWASWRPFPPPVSSTPLMTSRREAAGSFQTPLCTVSSEISSVFLFFFTAHGNLSFKLCGGTTSWCQLAAGNEEAETVLEPSAGAWWDFSSGRGEADSSRCQALITHTHTYRSMCVSTYNTTHSLRRQINTSNIFLQWSNCELKYNKCLLYVCVCTTRQRQHYELVKQR